MSNATSRGSGGRCLESAVGRLRCPRHHGPGRRRGGSRCTIHWWGRRCSISSEAMTRSEEERHVGTERQATGRARLRKYVVTEQQQTIPVRHEEVRVVREPITDANADDALSGAEISPKRSMRSLCMRRGLLLRPGWSRSSVYDWRPTRSPRRRPSPGRRARNVSKPPTRMRAGGSEDRRSGTWQGSHPHGWDPCVVWILGADP